MERVDIQFLPTRINQPPIVYKGLTGQEIVLVLSFGSFVGLVVGVLLMFVFQAIAIVPTLIFAMAMIFLQVGGTVVRQVKRGKPATWMYRSIQFAFAKKGVPVLGGSDLFIRSEVFSTLTQRKVHKKKDDAS